MCFCCWYWCLLALAYDHPTIKICGRTTKRARMKHRSPTHCLCVDQATYIMASSSRLWLAKLVSMDEYVFWHTCACALQQPSGIVLSLSNICPFIWNLLCAHKHMHFRQRLQSYSKKWKYKGLRMNKVWPSSGARIVEIENNSVTMQCNSKAS